MHAPSRRTAAALLTVVATTLAVTLTAPTSASALGSGATDAGFTGLSVAQAKGPTSVSDPAAVSTVTTDGDSVRMVTKRTDQTVLTGTVTPAADVTWSAGSTLPLRALDVAGGVHVQVSDGVATTCEPTSGTVTVVEATHDEGSALTSLAVDWSGACADGSSTWGQLRWNAESGYSGFDAPSVTTAFGAVYMGDVSAAKTVTWTARGTQPITARAAQLLTEDTPWFLVTQDGCGGKTLTPGQTCSVSVKTSPRAPSVRQERITLGDSATAPSFGAGALTVDGRYGAKGSYQSLTPKRVLDTRSGLGAPKALVGPGKSITLTVLGRGGVPTSGVAAVVLNLTAVGTTAPTYLTAYPAGSTRPVASSLNAPKGYTGANTVTVRPGTGGAVTIYNNAGSTHLLADVSGFYRSTNAATIGTDYEPVLPERVLDTRAGGGALPAGFWIDQPLSYGTDLGVVRAYALNVTVTGATGPGYVTVWGGSEDPSSFSTVNVTKGSTRSNTVVSQARYDTRDGRFGPGFGVFNGMPSGSAHVIVDVVGVYVDGQAGEGRLRFKPTTTPMRILDSRTSLGAKTWTARSTRTITPPTSVAGWDTYALVGNATLVAPTAATYLSFYAAGDPRPGTSNVNAAAGAIVANGVTVEVNGSNQIEGYNNAGTANAIYDVAGTFELFPPSYQALNGAVPPNAAAGRSVAGSDTSLGSRPAKARLASTWSVTSEARPR